jgi:hypothetical protein
LPPSKIIKEGEINMNINFAFTINRIILRVCKTLLKKNRQYQYMINRMKSCSNCAYHFLPYCPLVECEEYNKWELRNEKEN